MNDPKGKPPRSSLSDLPTPTPGLRSSRKEDEIICLCNNVSRSVIEKCITDGAKTLNEIFDQTTAGVGPCGGSCRKKLGPMLDTYLTTGQFPARKKKTTR